jgi:hypothetical protein
MSASYFSGLEEDTRVWLSSVDSKKKERERREKARNDKRKRHGIQSMNDERRERTGEK